MSGFRPLYAITLLIAAAAILGPFCAVFVFNRPVVLVSTPPFENRSERPAISEAEIAELQQLADKSCKCARTTSDIAGKDRCWDGFKRRTGAAPHDADLAGCYPIAPLLVSMGGGRNIVLSYSILADPHPHSSAALCSTAEALAAEAVYDSAMRDSRFKANPEAQLRHADAALVRFTHSILRGEAFTPAAPTSGCVSMEETRQD